MEWTVQISQIARRQNQKTNPAVSESVLLRSHPTSSLLAKCFFLHLTADPKGITGQPYKPVTTSAYGKMPSSLELSRASLYNPWAFQSIGCSFLLGFKNKHRDFCSFAAHVSIDTLPTDGKISCPEPARQWNQIHLVVGLSLLGVKKKIHCIG